MYKKVQKTGKQAADSSTSNPFAPRPFKVESLPQQDLNQNPEVQKQELSFESNLSSDNSLLSRISIFPPGYQPPVQPRVQMKLSIGEPDEGLEEEADVMGEQAEYDESKIITHNLIQQNENGVKRQQGQVNPTLQKTCDMNAMGTLAQLPATTSSREKISLIRTTQVQPFVIQRQVLSKIEIFPDKFESNEDWIGDVIIGGRSPSPFSGTMGAHSTAWVAHIDTVRRHLVNTTLTQGLEYMLTLVKEDLESPLLRFRSALDERHKLKLDEAKIKLIIEQKNLQGILAKKETLNKEKTQPVIQSLQSLINSYLTFVNYLPMSTVKGGDPSGHGEGSARGDLNLFEYAYANVLCAGDKELKPEFQKELKELGSKGFQKIVKEGATKKFQEGTDSLKEKLIKRLWMMFAIETPDVFAPQVYPFSCSFPSYRAEIWYYAILNFLTTIRKAYPYSYEFTEMYKVENQIKGLKSAIEEANYKIEENVLLTIFEWINTKKIEQQSEIRDDNSEVALSDLRQGGTGFQSTLLLEKDNTIGDVDLIGAVEMIGRTKSPFSGTMGAHTTAWVAHLDAIRRLLLKKTLPQALKDLEAKAKKMMEGDWLTLSSQISEKHQVFLIGAYNELGKNNQQVESVLSSNALEQTQFLEQYIFNYLSFVNFLPLSTIEVGKVPGGLSEAKHRKFLLQYEEIGEKIFSEEMKTEDKKKILQNHLYGLFDKKALKDFPPNLGERETTDFKAFVGESFTVEHKLYKFISGESAGKMDEKEANYLGEIVAYGRFFETIIEAYPRSTIDSGILQDKNLSPETVKAVEKTLTKIEQVINKETDQLNELITQNNCLINAIKKAAFGDIAQVTFEELLAIRMRIGEIGTMLFASPRVINIICDVLGINQGIVVIYPSPRPSEDFGDTSENPIMIRHTGLAHFKPYVDEPSVGGGGMKRLLEEET